MTVEIVTAHKPHISKASVFRDLRAALAANPLNPLADYSIAQVLAWSGMSSATFYRLRKSGNGPVIRKRGRRTFVRGSDFLTWRDTVQ